MVAGSPLALCFLSKSFACFLFGGWGDFAAGLCGGFVRGRSNRGCFAIGFGGG